MRCNMENDFLVGVFTSKQVMRQVPTQLELSQLLGMPLSDVRKVADRLSSLGLVTVMKSRRMDFTKISYKMIVELYQLRRAVELTYVAQGIAAYDRRDTALISSEDCARPCSSPIHGVYSFNLCAEIIGLLRQPGSNHQYISIIDDLLLSTKYVHFNLGLIDDHGAHFHDALKGIHTALRQGRVEFVKSSYERYLRRSEMLVVSALKRVNSIEAQGHDPRSSRDEREHQYDHR